MERVRVGVIGCGSIGTWHIDRLQKAGAEVVAICDIRQDRLEQVKAEFEVPKAYTDYEDLLARKDLEAVVVALPNYLHKPVTVAAFQAGKHVLCEKPTAMNTAGRGDALGEGPGGEETSDRAHPTVPGFLPGAQGTHSSR